MGAPARKNTALRIWPCTRGGRGEGGGRTYEALLRRTKLGAMRLAVMCGTLPMRRAPVNIMLQRDHRCATVLQEASAYPNEWVCTSLKKMADPDHPVESRAGLPHARFVFVFSQRPCVYRSAATSTMARPRLRGVFPTADSAKAPSVCGDVVFEDQAALLPSSCPPSGRHEQGPCSRMARNGRSASRKCTLRASVAFPCSACVPVV